MKLVIHYSLLHTSKLYARVQIFYIYFSLYQKLKSNTYMFYELTTMGRGAWFFSDTLSLL